MPGQEHYGSVYGTMAQSFPTTPEVIYDTLVADATFSSYVGEYEFVGGNKLPSISVQTPGAVMPNLKKVTGLEVIIHDVADLRRRDFYGSTNVETNWKVFLVVWEGSDGSGITGATRRAMEIFRGSVSFETVAVADGLGAMAQSMLEVPSDQPITV